MKSVIFLRIVSLIILLGIILSGQTLKAQGTIPLPDQRARTSPDWFTQGIIYQIQPRAFTPEGTLKAATARMKAVADLGATIVYLCPVFVMDGDMDPAFWSSRQKASGMNSPYNPYRIKDYYHVDPEYGSDEDLMDFIKEAHRLGLKVMLDMVYLHAGVKPVFIKDHPDFFILGADGKPANAQWNFPRLNFKNPELRKYLLDNMKYWINDFDVDGFRCDVSDGIPLDFWENSRKELELIRPDIAMLAEGERPTDQLKAFDANYSFSWFRSLSKVYSDDAPASTLKASWEEIASARPVGARMLRYIDNHDISNDDWYKRKDETWGIKGSNAALVMSFTLDGIPFVYNGQEAADKARHSIFGRLSIHWSHANTAEGKQRLRFLKELIRLRQSESTLAHGTTKWIANDAPNEVASYVRELNGEQILTVINLKNRKIKVQPDLQKGTTTLIENGVSSGSIQNGLELEGYGYWVGRIQK